MIPQILKREDYNRDEEGGEQAGEINCGGKVKRNGKNSCARMANVLNSGLISIKLPWSGAPERRNYPVRNAGGPETL